MAAGDLITTDWQMEYGGLLLGDETPYSLVRVTGLTNLPEVRSSDRAGLRRHGLTPGDDFLGARVIGVTLEVFGETAEDFAQAVDNLAGSIRGGEDEGPLAFRLPGVAGSGTRFVNARLRRRDIPVGLEFYYRIPVVELEFLATDPRIYDVAPQTGQTVPPTTSGGLTFPLTPPFAFGTVGVGGSINAVNAGSFSTLPRFIITGPVTNPRLENVNTGQVMAFTITLDTGEFLEVDASERTILLGGTATRYYALDPGSEWIDLPPGTSEVTYRVSSGDTSTLTMTWRSAWV